MLTLRSLLAQFPEDADEDRQKIIRQFVANTILPGDETAGPVNVRLAIADIADKLDQVATCATNCRGVFCWRGPQCDEETSAALFCNYSRSFHMLYGDVLDEIRATYGNRYLGVASRSLGESKLCTRP